MSNNQININKKILITVVIAALLTATLLVYTTTQLLNPTNLFSEKNNPQSQIPQEKQQKNNIQSDNVQPTRLFFHGSDQLGIVIRLLAKLTVVSS
jgi:cell division protein FtsL